MVNVLKKKTVSFYHFRSIVANYMLPAMPEMYYNSMIAAT